MADVHQLPDTDEAERAASEWIARLNADDVTADDRARFETWRSAHPRHAREYDELSATWRELAEAGSLVRAVSFGDAMNAAASPPRRRWMLVAAAASIALIAVGGFWYWKQYRAETLFQTAIGEHASVNLPDGSSLELNSNSLAKIEYREHERVIRLERGEAFFNVAHDTARPFWVVAGNSWVRAVGTAFNVYVKPTGVEVTVSEGTVKVTGEGPGRGVPSDIALAQVAVSVLTAGEQAEVRGSAAAIRSLRPVELTRSVSWRQGTVYFENQPLGDVVNEMKRYTTVEIEIGDESLRALPVGGTFQANPAGAEALLTMLKDGFGLHVRREAPDHVSIEAASAD